MLCKDCPKKDDQPTCSPEYMGKCEICGDGVLLPCDTTFINDNGVICHGGCK